MKRLFVLMLVGALVIGVGVVTLAETVVNTPPSATATINDVDASWSVVNWIILYIPVADLSVNLGTDVGGSYYDPDTDVWDPVTDGANHNAYVITNAPDGYTLTVSAVVPTGMLGDLARFQIEGGDLSWTSLNTTQTLKTTSAAAIDHISDIQYQYLVNETDAAGDYAVTVTYTVTTN